MADLDNDLIQRFKEVLQSLPADKRQEMYSRLNHNEELPCCARCERRFIPSHTEREYIKRFGDDGQYRAE